MAIRWSKKIKNEAGNYVWVDAEVTHVGLVMSSSWSKECRVMSDVYADRFSCRVWNAEKGLAEILNLGTNFENDSRRGHVVGVDAAPEVIAAYKLRCELAEKAREEANEKARLAHYEADARSELLALRRGSEVVVVKGRKVPKGTRGTISWMGEGNYGARVGIVVNEGDKPLYTAESNVVAVLPGGNPEDVPVGGWIAALAAHRDARAEWSRTLPKKGDKVRVLSSGIVMTVGWARDSRLGLKRKGAKRGEDFTWANASEVHLLSSDGEEVASGPEPKAALKVAPKVEPAAAPASPLSVMPEPYCRIHDVCKDSEGNYSAFDAGGRFLLLLPEPSALLVLSYLEAAAVA